MAIQTADPSCADGSGAIYVDCGNGTVTDNRSGRVWLADASCFGELSWHDAMKFVDGLADLPDTSMAAADDCGLSDGSAAGEWRLPSATEWEAMTGDAGACDPPITDAQGTGCWSSDCNGSGACAFSGVVSSPYWSSTSLVATPSSAWTSVLGPGLSLAGKKSTARFHVWPVRGGQ